MFSVPLRNVSKDQQQQTVTVCIRLRYNRRGINSQSGHNEKFVIVYESWTHNADYRTRDVVSKTKSLMREEWQELERPSGSGE